jgi:hypothetical protein
MNGTPEIEHQTTAFLATVRAMISRAAEGACEPQAIVAEHAKRPKRAKP